MDEKKLQGSKEGLLQPSKIVGSSNSPQKLDQGKRELITLTGITTSQVQRALRADNPYPARVFLKDGNRETDIPIFFRVKDKNGWIKPKIKTGSLIEVKGYFDNPKNGSSRKSFTAYSYKILEKEPNYYLEGKKCLSCQKPAQKVYFSDATSEPQHFFCAEIVCFEKWAKIHQPSQIFESYGK